LPEIILVFGKRFNDAVDFRLAQIAFDDIACRLRHRDKYRAAENG
jgi:hypothetical protein